MITLAEQLSTEQKAVTQGQENQNQFYQLICYVLGKDLLHSLPVVSQSALTLGKYIEMVYRWSFFFHGEELCQLI